jgi:ADP-heptose:LPS heptosyltransferase
MRRLEEAWIDLNDYESVLIIKPSSLGDIVHAIPCAGILKKRYPHLKIRWLANTEWMSLVENHPWIDEVIEYPRRQFRGLSGMIRAWRWYRAFLAKYGSKKELSLDLQGLLRSGVMSVASGCEVRVGMSDSREGARLWMTNVVEVEETAHSVDRYLQSLKVFGIEIDSQEVEFFINAKVELKDRLKVEGDYILLHPWSRGEGKSLSLDQIIEFCNGLKGHQILLVGHSPVMSLDETARLTQMEHVLNLTHQTSLLELVKLSQEACFCVSVDSGPLHLAAAVNPRCLGLYFWSDPRKVGPYSGCAWVWKAGVIGKRMDLSAGVCSSVTGLENSHLKDLVRFLRGQLEK